MSEVVPAGAFPDCEKFEQQIATMDLGGPKKAFTSRRDSLVAMRNAVNRHETEIDDLGAKVAEMEEILRDRPF